MHEMVNLKIFMRHKYIEETFSRWSIFGEMEDGITVYVANTLGDVVTHIKRDEANYLVKERDAIIDALCEAVMLHDNKAYEVFATIRDKYRESIGVC
jgi:Golgi nucleoside diphosphatase